MPRPHPDDEIGGACEAGVQVVQDHVAEIGEPVVGVDEPVTRSGHGTSGGETTTGLQLAWSGVPAEVGPALSTGGLSGGPASSKVGGLPRKERHGRVSGVQEALQRLRDRAEQVREAVVDTSVAPRALLHVPEGAAPGTRSGSLTKARISSLAGPLTTSSQPILRRPAASGPRETTAVRSGTAAGAVEQGTVSPLPAHVTLHTRFSHIPARSSPLGWATEAGAWPQW
jgi:hypothetical protein